MAQPYARRSLYENKRGFGETDLCTFPTGIVMNTLVIIESPNKAPTIKSCLGKGYKVVASKGHVRDLPKSKLGIDIENSFEPQYINIRGKGELINELKKEAKKSDFVLLATDPDREGEAIAWHLAKILEDDKDKITRVTFNEITKSAVQKAIKEPRDIDLNTVDAQQARRVLDRIVGYKISPLLWKKVKRGLSAGRVQSVAVRLIVDRETEIENFIPQEYWNIYANLKDEKSKKEFEARFYGKNGKKFKMYKFRTMYENAQDMINDFTPEQMKEWKENFKLQDDPRITKVGKFLRKTSLDEWPQFVSILTSKMSLVGPRPYLPREKEDMSEYYKYIIQCKPGITGYWQIAGRSNVTFQDRLDLDIKYYETKSLKNDIKILLKTFIKVFVKEGAI